MASIDENCQATVDQYIQMVRSWNVDELTATFLTIQTHEQLGLPIGTLFRWQDLFLWAD